MWCKVLYIIIGVLGKFLKNPSDISKEEENGIDADRCNYLWQCSKERFSHI